VEPFEYQDMLSRLQETNDLSRYFRFLHETTLSLINNLELNDLLTAIINRAAEAVFFIATDIPIYDYLKRLAADGENISDYGTIWYHFQRGCRRSRTGWSSTQTRIRSSR